MMKITFILPNLSFKGGTRVISIYADRLKKRGHEVNVISIPKQLPSFNKRLQLFLKGKGWRSRSSKVNSYFDNIDINLHILDSHRLVNDDDVPDADVVVATWWQTAPGVAQLSACKGSKVYFIQDYGIAGQELEKIVPTWRLPMYKITISNYIADLFYQHCQASVIEIIPNSVDYQHFYSPPRHKQQRPSIGFIYRKEFSKGTDIAIDAVKLVRKRLTDLQVLCFGSQKPVRNLSLPPGTTFVYRPSDHEIKQLYTSCDAWLFPSRLEGFGLPILEAMACRTPVIGTSAGAAPELLTPDVGFLVDLDNPEDMAKAIETICRYSDTQWCLLSDAAYAKATSYSWDDATDLFEAALNNAINSRN